MIFTTQIALFTGLLFASIAVIPKIDVGLDQELALPKVSAIKKNLSYTIVHSTNRTWLRVVCTLIDNNTCHHSGQNNVDSPGAAEWVHNKFWPFWWPVSLSIRVQTMLNHISICFLPQYQPQRKCFFSECKLKKVCVIHWREQCCLDSYWQWQISQSDCEISSNYRRINY